MLDQMRQLAQSWLADVDVPLLQVSLDPIQSLQALRWKIPAQGTQIAVTEANLRLEPTYCLGRVALGAAYLERYFPTTRIEYAEVLTDALANILKRTLSHSVTEDKLRELLQYEEPHCVLLIDGTQFDPLSIEVGFPIEHPRVAPYPIWEGVASGWLVAKSLSEPNADVRIKFLQEAEAMCPNTTLVAENKCAAYLSLNRYDEAETELKKAITKRPTARSLFCAYLLGDSTAHRRLVQEYSVEMVSLLRREVAT